MKNLRVGVLRGGPSNEYETSIKTGASVLTHLPEGMTGVDIFIGRDGKWHVGGIPVKEGEALSRVDVVWNALHGAYGEDGTVQRLLETFRIPYTGSEPHQSFVGIQKARTKEGLTGLGFRLPRHQIFRAGENSAIDAAHMVFQNVAPPWIVKPIAGGSSIGIFIVQTFPDLVSALSQIIERGGNETYIIEEFIRGTEATVGIIDDFRDEELYALPPVEINPPEKSQFFDYDAKYGGESKELCPGNFTREEKEALMEAARRIHKTLGLRHYSRSDFIVSRGKVYFLEVNTLPGLTKQALFPKALHAVGASLTHFIDHTLSRAIRNQ